MNTPRYTNILRQLILSLVLWNLTLASQDQDDMLSLTLEVGYIYPESMEIVIKNSYSNNITLQYSKIEEPLNDDPEIKESEVSMVIKTDNSSVTRIELKNLDPDSEYKICAVVHEIYACEMARTFKHADNRRALITGAASAMVALLIILLILIMVYITMRCKYRKYRMKNKLDKPANGEQNLTVQTIS